MPDLKTQIEQILAGKSSKAFVAVLRSHPVLLQQLIAATDHYQPKNFSERLWILLQGEPPFCSQGVKRQFNTWELGYRAGCVLGNQCACVGQLRMQAQKQTLMKKYGVDTVNAIPGVAHKRTKTIQQRYGVNHAAQNPQIQKKMRISKSCRTPEQLQAQQNKRKQTCMRKYGAEHHMQTAQCLNKQQQTNQERYGVNRPLQNQSIAKKSAHTQSQHTAEQRNQKEQRKIETLLHRYSVTAPSRISLSADVLEILDDGTRFCELAKNHTREQLCAKLNVHPHTVYLYSKRHSADHLFVKPRISGFEQSVRDYVSQYQHTVYSDRTILNGKELDIFLPSLNLAIECSGLYWHSELASGKHPDYHADKYQQCRQQQIRLITIWEDQWLHRRSQCESRLQHLLKLSRYAVSARQCEVQKITPAQSAEFINCYHLQGSISATHHLGLTHRDQLIAVMTFRKPRFNSNTEWEIIRFATAGSVPGGASRLFQSFIRQHDPDSVVSYCDLSWGDGGVYDKMGFQHQATQTGYWYTDYKFRHHRMQFQKSQISNLVAGGAEMSEWEIMQQLGWDRIWDCGQSRWVWYK